MPLHRTKKDTASGFSSLYEAPTSGYERQIVLSVDRTKQSVIKKEVIGDSEYLIFRVRTVLDEKGNVVNAKYGKIYGEIGYGEVDNGSGGIVFIYFFNPDGTRNLEFNPKQNLFKWKHDAPENVYEP